ncbi:hypothetical protein BDY21DRAFT_376612 [Lineolata rhizophorae]|uniref:U1-C C2H2-type zinc finger domain-containing protein n=1 Tax=Lineolata rhizophorae TaxID=578093 RepID=A0A6A6PA18_9PEZI|nr:hypothetical protein BDY21DRAFT_376612 [Lineolata rhizophorae]
MAEYWKSTPKYWCKFCRVYIRDTPFERRQHDATGRHQSAIQRNLRDLHRDAERSEREKQRARDEVARLNGAPTGLSSAADGGAVAGRKPATERGARGAAVSADERKRQMMQLAEMGVAIPEEFRRDMAMAGEWTVVSEKPVASAKAKGEESENPEGKAVGVRKRKVQDEDEEAVEGASGEKRPRKVWGSTLREYPGSKGKEDVDIEALLGVASVKREEVKKEEEEEGGQGESKEEIKQKEDEVKKEEPADDGAPPLSSIADVGERPHKPVKAEEGAPAPTGGVVFKKRKHKGVR